MCGISAILNCTSQAKADEKTIIRMNDIQIHRGPDGDGVKLCEYSGLTVGLGHRRLSIVDLEGGSQPMSNEDGTVWITFNGEIYNHLDLRHELVGLGHRFATDSDTEAIVHAYEQWGVECVHRLRGMFAFVIWDEKKRSLFAARDRLGVKPLYFATLSGSLLLASEVKAILATKWIRPELNTKAVPELMTFGFIAGEETLFAGIRKLLPGHRLCWHEGRVSISQYWDIPQPSIQSNRSDADYIEEFRWRFEESVQMRLMSDVPLGVFLSGGIDSSAIAATMAAQASDPIQTFSVGYESDYYSEFDFAREVARAIDAEHHEVVMRPSDLFLQLPRFIWHEDATVRTPSSVALYHVAQLAGQHVKVVLTGEGSDELFAGYSRYWASLFNLRWGRSYERMLPKAIRERWIRDSFWKWPLPHRVKQKLSHTFLNHSMAPEEIIFDNFVSIFPRRIHSQLFSDEVFGEVKDVNPYRDALSILGNRDEADPLEQLLYADQKMYLVELLKKQDKMSMAASIESRVPFLDHELVEFACTVPRRMKLRGRQEKLLVKRTFEKLLPPAILKREKMGFPVPTKQWLNQGYNDFVAKVLLSQRTAQRGIFRRSFLASLLEQQQAGARDHTDALWTALNFELWARVFIDGNGFASTECELQSEFEPKGSSSAIAMSAP